MCGCKTSRRFSPYHKGSRPGERWPLPENSPRTAMARRRTETRSDEENIIARLRYGSPQVLVILIIPSHDRKKVRLNDQHLWASQAMDLFGQMYTGATAFQALDGVFLDDDGVTLLHDKPILVESYVEREL